MAYRKICLLHFKKDNFVEFLKIIVIIFFMMLGDLWKKIF